MLVFPGGAVVKNLLASAGDSRDMGSVLHLGKFPGGGNGNPLQYCCLKNSMDREAWRATVHGVTKSWTRLNTHTHTHIHTHRYTPFCSSTHQLMDIWVVSTFWLL